MFGTLRSFDGGLFDEFRRLEREMEQIFGSDPWANGIRASSRGAYPPINVGSTPDQIDVYLFAPGVDPKRMEITIHQAIKNFPYHVKTNSTQHGSPATWI